MTDQATPPVPVPLTVTQSHVRLLQAINRYERLTALQATRVLFSRGSLTYAQGKLRQLFRAGYVRRKQMGRDEPHGSTSYVYTLDRRGRAYLQSLGEAVPGRLRQSEEDERAPLFLRHSVAVVDTLILCDLLARATPSFRVARMVGERALRSQPLPVPLPDGTTRGVAPDAWVEWHIGGVEQMCVAFEVDNGTEFQRAWRRKVQALLAYEIGPYPAAFGVETLTVAVVAGDAARARQLHRWTTEELNAHGQLHRADLFRLTAMPEDRGDATGFFLAPRWTVPGQTGPVPLLEG